MFHLKANSDCLIKSIVILQHKGHFIFETTIVFFFKLNVFGNFVLMKGQYHLPGSKYNVHYICLYGKAPSERGIFFRPQVEKRVGI